MLMQLNYLDTNTKCSTKLRRLGLSMNSRRLVVVNLVIFLIIIIGGFAGYYFYNQSTLYLKTDNAMVGGQQIVISSPVTGKLLNWQGDVGNKFSAGNAVGTVQVQQGSKTVDVAVPSPSAGTIVANNATSNEYVAPGEPLAYAYDLDNLYVTANIKETDLKSVKVGQSVDVYVDAQPGITISGTVSQIGLATAATFSLLPTQSTTADYTKVTQVVPVTISLQGSQGIGLVPGMSASVRIHK
jgi:multidrug resistance efflux pump